MIVALWMTPALLAGLFAILWVTTRLERLVLAPLVAGETPTSRASGPASLPLPLVRPPRHGRSRLEDHTAPLRQGEEAEGCTSEEERSS